MQLFLIQDFSHELEQLIQVLPTELTPHLQPCLAAVLVNKKQTLLNALVDSHGEILFGRQLLDEVPQAT
jgi:hypothetical protein